jgi:hypothetical protein
MPKFGMPKDTNGYCSTCGEWATTCQTVIVFGSPEKVCEQCRTN